MKLELQNVCLLWELQQQTLANRNSSLHPPELENHRLPSRHPCQPMHGVVRQLRRAKSHCLPHHQETDSGIIQLGPQLTMHKEQSQRRQAQLAELQAERDFLRSQLQSEMAQRLKLSHAITEREADLERLRDVNSELQHQVEDCQIASATQDAVLQQALEVAALQRQLDSQVNCSLSRS